MTQENYREKYIAMLAGRGMKIGDKVACDYRRPCAHQWWIAPFWIGVIEDVSTDSESWNRSNSEAYYCSTYLYVRVQYLASSHMAGFSQHDQLGSLQHVHEELTGSITKSPSFGSDEYQSIREFASKIGWQNRYPKQQTENLAA